MLFSIIIIVLILAITFFHYLQGLFSATLSAICAIIAAVLAVSYHESLVDAFFKRRYSDQAHAIVLVVLFAAIYMVLRILFDRMVPGNVRLPAVADKVGGAAMGVIAAIFGTGVLAIAAQALPFGPSIAGYSRYEVTDRDVSVSSQAGRRSVDMATKEELVVEGSGYPAVQLGLLMPVDDMLVNTVAHLSDGGSLAGDRSFKSVHPDYIQELYGTRLGVQVGAKHTATTIKAIEGVFTVASLPQVDAETQDIRQTKLPETLKPPENQMIVVVRAIFDKNTSDKDWFFRFSPGSVRLVANGANYYPVGTLDAGRVLKANRIDDFLLVELRSQEQGADLVFVVDKENLLGTDGAGMKIADGTFIEIKRLAREDLSGKEIQKTIPPSDKVVVLRKGAPPDSRRQRQQQQPPTPTPEQQAPPTTPETPAPTTPAAPATGTEVQQSPMGVPSAR